LDHFLGASMPLARTTNKIYINRDIDTKIKKIIADKTGKLVFVHGHGGVGKSTLLKQTLQFGAKELQLASVFINLQGNNFESFVGILLDEDVTTVKNCPRFEEVRNLILKEPKLLYHILDSYDKETKRALQAFDLEDNPSFGLLIGAIYDLVKFVSKLKGKALEKKKKELLNYTELALLNALVEDFENKGLFIVDTFEKIKNLNIKSKINFLESGEISGKLIEKNYQFRYYIEGLIYLLVEKCTFIIAGRNNRKDLEMGKEIPTKYIQEFELKEFSYKDIKKYFSSYSQNHQLSMPSTEQLQLIEELTNGNPLLVTLFPRIAEEYAGWDELDYAEMQRRISTDDKYGLLFYLTDRVLSHLNKDNTDKLWKLVIPRVLTEDIKKLLLGENSRMLTDLVDAGLASKGSAWDSEKYQLHDDVHRAILNHSQRTYKNGFCSWHDSDEVKTLHQALINFFNQNDLKGVNCEFEIGYHNIMLRKNFENEFETSRDEFALAVMGSILLSYDNKLNIFSKIQNNSDELDISGLIKQLQDEKHSVLSEINRDLYHALTQHVAQGKNNLGIYDITLLTKLTKQNQFKKDMVLFRLLGESYGQKGDYDQAIATYKKAIEINPEYDQVYYNMGIAYDEKGDFDQAIAAYKNAIKINPEFNQAYNNMGSAYDEKGDYDQAIATYKNAIKINPEFDQAYNNMGSAYDGKGDYDQAIAAYKKAIEINPELDQAYYNMGIAYGNKGDYDQAIAAYKKAIEINPEDDQAYFNMGNSYSIKGDYDQAIAAYQKALEINSTNNSSYTNLFEAQLIQNQELNEKLGAQYVDLYQNKKDRFINYEMLLILQDIKNQKKSTLKSWQKKYQGVVLDWGFDELDMWVGKMPNSKIKDNLLKALTIFKQHSKKSD
jgi:tetratricopeptide (TPR) repeat protein